MKNREIWSKITKMVNTIINNNIHGFSNSYTPEYNYRPRNRSNRRNKQELSLYQHLGIATLVSNYDLSTQDNIAIFLSEMFAMRKIRSPGGICKTLFFVNKFHHIDLRPEMYAFLNQYIYNNRDVIRAISVWNWAPGQRW